MLSINNVSKSYKRGKNFQVLDNINLKIKKNEFVIIKGVSGCGKTTLLHIMSSLLKPDSGKVIIKDTDIYSIKEAELLNFRKKYINFLFQESFLFKELTVLENIILSNPNLCYKPEFNDRISYFTAKFGLDGLLNHMPDGLSPGEMQRVAFCRAIANEPEILFMDEPFSSLDKKNKYIMADIIQEYWNSGTTIIMVSHESDFIEKYSKKITVHK